jgi:ABC-type transport system substrate-binding protein
MVGRMGIMAPEQINDPSTCATNLIGTGPFKLDEWKPNEKLVVTKNPKYWQKGYPKADKITFVPVVEAQQRVNELQGGQLDLMHTSAAPQIQALRNLGSQAKLLVQKPGVREVRYYMLNAAKPPLDDINARMALAYALDRKEINTIQNQGLFDVADGPYDSGTPGYAKNPGFPKHNVKKAKELADAYKAAHGGEFNVTLLTTTDPDNAKEASLMQAQLKKAGISAEISQVDQSSQINEALSGNFNVLLWRNLHDDAQWQDVGNYVWFSTGSPVNFGKFTDPDLQALLDEGRAATTIAEQKAAYSKVAERFAEQVWNIWGWYVDWAIGSQPNVKGVNGAPLPDGGGMPQFIYGRISLLALAKS